MSYARDIEDILEDVLSVMKTDSALNNAIQKIENEKVSKSRGLEGGLKSVPDNAYYFQTWNDKILNEAVAVFYGVEDQNPDDAGPESRAQAESYKIFIEILVLDDGMKDDAVKRVMRYAKALKELFNAQLSDRLRHERVTLTLKKPMAIRAGLNTSQEYKIGGLELSVTLV